MDMMIKHENFIRLIQRSPSDQDGWIKVSRVLLPLVRNKAASLGKAVELHEQEDGTGKIRLIGVDG